MAKNCHFFAENSVFFRQGRELYGSIPYFERVRPTEKWLELYWTNLLGVAGPPAQEKNSFRPKMAEKCQNFAENSVFLENNRVGGTPLSIFEGL